MDAYNTQLLNKFKDSLCFCAEGNRFSLYLKSTKAPTTQDEILQIGFLWATSTEAESPDVKSVEQSWAVSGFGNLLYAFAMMELNERGYRVCCDRNANLSEDADLLWQNIQNNAHYTAKALPPEAFCEEYLEDQIEYGDWDEFPVLYDLVQTSDDIIELHQNEDYVDAFSYHNKSYTTKPDSGYKLVCDNHEMSEIARLPKLLAELGDRHFDAIHSYKGGYDDTALHDLKQNNYEKLVDFVEGEFGPAFDEKLDNTIQNIENRKKIEQRPNAYLPHMLTP